jgi:dynein heavy chain, axonemal
MGLDPEERSYEEIPSVDRAVAIMTGYLEDMNASKASKTELVLFQDAVEHITRTCRILRQPRGNALLVGVGGSGKATVTRFAAHMGGFDCFSIELAQKYGPSEFREDLKTLYKKVGAKSGMKVSKPNYMT